MSNASITEQILMHHQVLNTSGEPNNFFVNAGGIPIIGPCKTHKDASQVIIGMIANMPEKYKPELSSLTEKMRNLYQASIDELDDAGCLPTEFEHEGKQYDTDETWQIQTNLGLTWLFSLVDLGPELN